MTKGVIMAIIPPRRYVERQIGLSEERIKNWIYENGKEKPKRSIFTSVSSEIYNFLNHKNHKNVIIIPGLRGIGKTTLLFQLYDELQEHFEKERMLYLTCDDLSNFELDLMEVLNAYEKFFLQSDLETLSKDKKVIIFLDEAHYQEDWAKKVKSYSDRSTNLLFIATGSSALSLEITSDLARRKKEFDMFPLNLPEYLRITKLAKNNESITPPTKAMEKIKRAIFGSLNQNKIQEKLEVAVPTVRTKYLSNITPWEPKLEKFLIQGGFPFCVDQKKREIHEDILEVCQRVSREDLPLVSPVGKRGKVAKSGLNTLQLISDSPTFSLRRIAESIGNISRESISNLLEGYNKAGLIQILKPYGSAKEMTRKANEYYFASPTLQAALWERAGVLTEDTEQLGQLWETFVANSIVRMKRDLSFIQDIFYDYRDGGADFVVQLRNGNLVAVEVGWGGKGLRQVLKTLKRVDGDYGLVVSDRSEEHQKLETEEGKFDVYFLPKEVFMVI